jgi:O-antigen/teichoic acid export membrane protein
MLFFTLALDFGLNAIVVREMARDKSISQRYFANLVSLRIVLAVLLVAFGSLLLFFTPYPPLLRWGIFLALLILLPHSFSRSSNALFQANFRYDFSAAAFVLGQGLILLLALLGFWGGGGVLFFVGVSLLGHFLMAALAGRFVGQLGFKLSFGFDKQLWRRVVVAALPLGLMLIFSQVIAKTDLFLLSLLPLPQNLGLNSSETVGVYSLAYRIFTNVVILPTFFMNAFFPVMVADYKDDRERFKERFRKGVVILFFVSILGAGIGFLLAPWIVRVLAGEGFAHSATALRILILGLPLFYLSSPLQWFLVTVGKEKILPFIYAVAAVVSVALNILFIPLYSYQASVVIVLVVEGLVLVGLVGAWFAQRKALFC